MALRSYTYRLRLDRAQSAALNVMLRDFCGLYDAGLQQRIEFYRGQWATLSYVQQAWPSA